MVCLLMIMMVKNVAFAVTMDIDTRNIDILAMPFAGFVSLPLQQHTNHDVLMSLQTATRQA
jgi:hypothetical protein